MEEAKGSALTSTRSGRAGAAPLRWAVGRDSMTAIRKMAASEIDRIVEIDRSEEVAQDYLYQDGRLVLKEVEWHVPRWSADGAGPHTVQGKIKAWRPILDSGGTTFGAFDGESLVGFAIYRPDLSERTAQLVVLHVSRSHRRRDACATILALLLDVGV